MRFDHDDDVLDIVNEINQGLHDSGPEYQIQLDDGEYDGYILADVVLTDDLLQY